LYVFNPGGFEVKTDVYIVKCGSYDEADEKVGELLSMMGGIGKFAKNGEKIALKVNLLSEAEPEKAVTTHPAIVAAVGALAKKEGAAPLIVDSPGAGFRYSEGTLEKVYETCGMNEAAKRAGIELNKNTDSQDVSNPQGKVLKKMKVIDPILNADGVFNLCKMKTHMFMQMTGAVKNSFGVIPGMGKVSYHAKMHKKENFADMLLDLSQFVSPRISIMDAVLALEGDGPGPSGTPRQVGLLIASEDPLALDVVAGEIMGLPRALNPVLLAADKRGMKPTKIDEINIIGEELSALKIPDYKFTKTTTKVNKRFPAIVKENCIGCGACAEACPQKTITIQTQGEKKYAEIDTSKCIRCYCCHEMCQNEAVTVKL